MLEIPGILDCRTRRRQFLRLGAYSAAAAWLNPSLLRGDTPLSPGAIRSCSVVMAGGGVAPGSTYGESDRTAAYPLTALVTPGDLAATIFWRFGIDPRLELHDPLGRPFPVAEGHPVKTMFSSIEA